MMALMATLRKEAVVQLTCWELTSHLFKALVLPIVFIFMGCLYLFITYVNPSHFSFLLFWPKIMNMTRIPYQALIM